MVKVNGAYESGVVLQVGDPQLANLDLQVLLHQVFDVLSLHSELRALNLIELHIIEIHINKINFFLVGIIELLFRGLHTLGIGLDEGVKFRCIGEFP